MPLQFNGIRHSINRKTKTKRRRRISNNSVGDLMMDDEEKKSAVVLASTDDADERIDNFLAAGPRHAVPWLMFRHGERGKHQTFFNICEPNNLYVKSLPEIHRTGRRLYQSPSSSSHQGWLIVTDDNSDGDGGIDCSLWNTVSSEKIQLPPIELKFSKYIIDAVCSSPFPNSDPQFMVLFLLYDIVRLQTLLLFCHPGDTYWIVQKLHFKSLESNPGALVEIKGKVYVMCKSFNRFLVIERNDKPEAPLSVMRSEYLLRTTFIIGPQSSISTGDGRCRLKYVQSGDELFMVCLDFHNRFRKEVVVELKVFRMDFSVIEWKEVTSLGDHVLFLGKDSAASCFATDMGLKRGSYVYFTLDEDTSLYKFDLEKGTISLSLPCPNIPTLQFSQEWMILPTSRTTKDENNKDMISKEPEKNKIIKNDEEEDEDEDMRTWVAVLDADIWPLITRNLNPVDYMHFRAVCREFRSVAPPVKWRTSTNTIRFKETYSLSPWLVFLEKNDGIYNFIDSMHNKERYLTKPSDLLLDARIRFSKDGWLLMSKGKRSMFFFNPFTKEIIRLPDIQQNYMLQGICFSSTPTSADCLVFATGDSYVEILCIRPRAKSWTRLSLHDPFLFREYEVSINNPVFYNGAFYCLDCDGALGVFHIGDGGVYWNVYGKNQGPCSSISQSFLVECEGELLGVFLGHWGEWVKVCRFVRFPEDEMTWVEVKSLGKHMLFISHTTCLSVVAPRSGMENKIYFPRFNGDKGIIYYSLDTCRFHSSGSQHSHQNFYDTDEQLYCSWIEPTRSQKNTT